MAASAASAASVAGAAVASVVAVSVHVAVASAAGDSSHKTVQKLKTNGRKSLSNPYYFYVR